MEKKNNQKQGYFTKRIGNTLFKVTVHFDESSTETFEDRLMHLMEHSVSEESTTIKKLAG